MTNQLHIEIYGQGKTIVLLHGWAMHTGVWRDFARQLAQHARVVCVDLPGHGRSPLDQPFALPAIATAIMDALDEAPCYWLGWSLGALVALEIARQAPEKVRGLILLAGTPCFVQQQGWVGMDAALLDTFAKNLAANREATILHFMALQVHGLMGAEQLLSTLKTYLAEELSISPEVLQAGLVILKNTDLRRVLASLSCPILAIFGTRDTIVPIAVATQVQQLSPLAQAVIIQKSGHVPFLSHPDATLQAINDFLHLDE